MKKIILTILVLSPAIYISCKQKQKNDFVSVLSYINSQVKKVDTSLYSIIKAEKLGSDSTWDTSYIKREEFRGLAGDFLSIPDITESSLSKNYKEERLYDEQLNRGIISYTALKEDLEITKEELVVAPGEMAFDKLRSVIIDRVRNNKDSSIQQRLLWQTDEKFQVVSIIEKTGKPTLIKTVEVTWNPPRDFQESTPAVPDTSQAFLKSRHKIDSLRRAEYKAKTLPRKQ